MDVRVQVENVVHLVSPKTLDISPLGGRFFARTLTPNQDLSLQVRSLFSPHGPPTTTVSLNEVEPTLA